MNTDENVPNIYSKGLGLGLGLGSGEELSIQGMSEFKSDMIIPIGFDVNSSGNYTINAGEILNFPAGTHVYLEDLTNKVSQDLTLNPTYTFYQATGNSQQATDYRFYLKFVTGQSTDLSVFEAYSNENLLIVKYLTLNPSPNGEGHLSVFNVLGQNVKELRMENGELRINLNVAPGTYLVRLVTNDRVYIKKVYIQ